MFSYHPDQMYDFIQERLQTRRDALQTPVASAERRPNWKDILLYRSGSLLVATGKRMQRAVNPDYSHPRMATEQ